MAALCGETPLCQVLLYNLVYNLVGLCVVLYLPCLGLQSAFKGKVWQRSFVLISTVSCVIFFKIFFEKIMVDIKRL